MTLNKKYIFSWTLFDFANSSFSAVIMAVIFPVYYINVIAFNKDQAGDFWWGAAVSLSMAVVALTSPFLGGIADYGGKRKRFLFIYTFICVATVACFSLLKPGMVFTGFILIVIANIGMEGGLVFYNSFLPEIAPADYQGRVSAWGFMVGYAGSIISLLISISLINAGKIELIWIMVALFFSIFSIPAFVYLQPDANENSLCASGLKGIKYTWLNIKNIWKRKEARKFLIAYFIYEDGVNTIIIFSSIFAALTLGFKTKELIGLYLLVQITALIGSLIMAKPIDIYGPKKIVIITLILWVSVCIFAFFVETKIQFWLLSSFAGLGLGSVQAAARAFFTQFVTKGCEAEYFGIYSLVGKSSAVLGPILFAHISAVFGSQRPAVLSIAALFFIGLVILITVKGGEPNIKTNLQE
ncbi:MAG TPA: MFS transporter [Lentisphaeria bacterium]|nr:MAG: hypothetical protein A2X47_05845 [Lentisphaerae bacterium GWF2_38_69]HBM14947.1 MFS transporter [Lentisphaeria bacterium]